MGGARARLEPGDILWANRTVKGLPYNHCGVYIGEGKVIHFAAPEGAETNQKNAVVHETSYKAFRDGCPVKVIVFPRGYSPEETVRRAKSRLGEKGYNFLLNNCDHFATWCKTGKHYSVQANEAKNTIRAIPPPHKDGIDFGEMALDSFKMAGEIVCRLHDVLETFKAPKAGGESLIARIRKKLLNLK